MLADLFGIAQYRDILNEVKEVFPLCAEERSTADEKVAAEEKAGGDERVAAEEHTITEEKMASSNQPVETLPSGNIDAGRNSNQDISNSPHHISSMQYCSSIQDDKERSNTIPLESLPSLQNQKSSKAESAEPGNEAKANPPQSENSEKQKKLRKKISKKYCSVIQNNFGFSVDKAKELTIKFEGKIKSLDPTIGDEYLLLIKGFHKVLNVIAAAPRAPAAPRLELI